MFPACSQRIIPAINSKAPKNDWAPEVKIKGHFIFLLFSNTGTTRSLLGKVHVLGFEKQKKL